MLAEAAGTEDRATDFLKLFRESVGANAFESEAELREAISSFKEDFNRRPLPVFLGLNANQMQRITREPIESLGDFVELRFPEDNRQYVATPIMRIALSIMLHIHTANGLTLIDNDGLPLDVVQGMYDHMPDLYELITPSLEKEDNLPELFIGRKLLEVSGITVIQDGQLLLTDLGAKLLEEVVNEKKAANLYRLLFLEYTNRFNWLVFSGFDKTFGFIQHAAMFDLLILHRLAHTFVNELTLANAFVNAFPSLRDKLTQKKIVPENQTPEALVADAFGILFIHKYCWFFGLLHQQANSKATGYRYMVTDLFKTIFNWKIEAVE